jgi:hypothetical protein
MPANYVAMEGSDGDALATPGGGRWELRRRCAAAVRFGKFQNKKPAADFLRASFAISAMMALCR